MSEDIAIIPCNHGYASGCPVCDAKEPAVETLSGPALHRKIAEVLERRSDRTWYKGWWREFDVRPTKGIVRDSCHYVIEEDWHKPDTFDQFRRYVFDQLIEFRHRPPKVKLSGEVEPEVIKWAEEVAKVKRECPEQRAAKALLSCVQEDK